MDRIYTAQGPQQAEKLLVEKVVAEARAAAENPALLKQPVLVVVPSSELRLALIGKLAAAGATLGVEVQTLHSVALNLHRAAGHDVSGGALLSEVLARRAVQAQPGLRESFEPLADGLGLVAATVRDLLTAGLTATDQAPAGLNRQAAEVLAAAQQTQTEMQQRGCRRPGDLQQAAAGLIDHLNARSVWIYGFADVTGQSRALVRALWQHQGKLVVDLPSDPAFGGEDRGARFARSFVQRVCAEELPGSSNTQSGNQIASNPSDSLPKREFFHTSGRSDEVREAAHRIRKQMDAGVAPESIGVVVRQYEAYAAHIKNWFTDLGVPFRAPTSPAGFFPDHRRMRAALEVMQLGGEIGIDRWLDSLSRSDKDGVLSARIEDFRIAMRALGVARLEQAAQLDANELAGKHGVYRLPLRVNAEESEVGVDGERRRSKNRVLTLTELVNDIGMVQQTMQRLRDWPQTALLSEHAEHARLLLSKDLGWSDTSADWPELLLRIAELDGGESYSTEEFLILLGKAARDYGVPKASAPGGGVAVLDYTQARGRTFDALFLLGLNKGIVPRAIADDPVLPDSQRAVLQSVLPDLPLRNSGHEEERYLFAQLCSAAPLLTLSWLRADDDGKETAPSSYLQRIWLGKRAGESEEDAHVVPRLRNDLFADATQLLTEPEAEQYFALRGDRGNWMQLQQQSAPRLKVLNEWEPDASDRKQLDLRFSLGPYFGLTASQPAPEQLFVTRLEGFARCPWQAFVERQLGIESVDDPLHDLPGSDALMLGNVVHDALEALVKEGAGGELNDKTPVKVEKPTASAISTAVKAAAMRVALAEEIRLQGMIDALATQAMPFVQRAVDLEWPQPADDLEVIGCEWQGIAKVEHEGVEFDLHFRADRVDQGEDGLVFTDYKTSKPITSGVGAATKRRHHLTQLSRGLKLQGTAYASSSFDASGRYLFLKVDEKKMDRIAEFKVDHDEEEFIEAFGRTSSVIYQSMTAGIHMPRMDRPKANGDSEGNSSCNFCKVADACMLRDSGNRNRMAEAVSRIAERRMMEDPSVAKDEQFITDLWYLGVTAPWQEEEQA